MRAWMITALALVSADPAHGQEQGAVLDRQPLSAPDPIERNQTSLFLRHAVWLVANREGLDATDLVVVNETRASYPLLAQQGYAFKMVHVPTAELYGIELDSSGNEVDADGLEAAELFTEQQLYGKLEPALHDLLEQLGPDDLVPVDIWLRDDGFAGVTRPLPSEIANEAFVDQIAATQIDMRRSFVQQLEAPVLQLLGQQGGEVIPQELVPVISAELNADDINLLATHPLVTSIELGGYFQQTLDVAADTIAAPGVWSAGYDGTGIKVAVIETQGGRAGTNASFLPIAEQDTEYSCWNGTHARQVASVIASTNPTYLGIAHGVSLFVGGSCSGKWSQLGKQIGVAIEWGARAINLSYGLNKHGTPTSKDKAMDDLIQNLWVFMGVSAGNGGGFVESPGTAYNVMTVGNLNDQGTSGIADDTISGRSDWVNPSSRYDDREKPEVAAPGTNITVNPTGSNPLTGSGTSFSAPMVTGAAALLMDRKAGLKIWPEALKAILMATAWNNVHGTSDEVGPKDGAGGIRCLRALNVVEGTTGGWGGVDYSCSAPTTLDVDDVYLEAGRRCRIVIVWDQHHGYGSYKKQPSADLDLLIRHGGTGIAQSTSWCSNFEMVDFTPAVSGTYQILIRKYRCDKTPKYVGWAWHQTQ
jgi:serine protease AprX